MQDGVGAVSGKIYTKKEKIYYAGTWKDIAGEYVYQFRGMDRTDSGYFHRQNMVQEIDGASELCFMTSRQLWRKWGEIMSTVDKKLKIIRKLRIEKALPSSIILPIYFEHHMHKKLDLKNPITFNEKLQ